MAIIARVIAAPVKGDLYRFDYGACLYPEGMVGDSLIYFNHEDVFKVVQEGYADDDNELMLEHIASNVKHPKNLRMPSGNEPGAWQGLWKPGGFTKGGIPEAVVDQFKPGDYTIGKIFE